MSTAAERTALLGAQEGLGEFDSAEFDSAEYDPEVVGAHAYDADLHAHIKTNCVDVPDDDSVRRPRPPPPAGTLPSLLPLPGRYGLRLKPTRPLGVAPCFLWRGPAGRLRSASASCGRSQGRAGS